MKKYIYENRSVRHYDGPDVRLSMKEFLIQEVNRAWAENDPCGRISCEWDEVSVSVCVKVEDNAVSQVQYTVVD